MTRQRPEYGELATPEEQRAAAGLPPLDHMPAVAENENTIASAEKPRAGERRGNTVDRVVTIALLAYGLVNVVTTGMSYLNFSALMDSTMDALGIDAEFTNFAQGRLWGTIASVVLAVGWTLTALWAISRLRRARLGWWVPLVGAVVTLALTSICVLVPMLGDPAFIEYATKVGAS